MKAKNKKTAKLWLCLSLVLCLVSMIAVSLIQTGSGSITIKQMTWESPSGHLLSADLWIPANATADDPAPAVVTIEGWYNNKEMQDLYTVELARRGYVVLTLDMHGHGDTEALPSDQLYDGAVGVDGAVQLVASLPYVDTARIGVTGHSSGGTAANMAVEIDNRRETPLIAAVLQQAGDWQDDTGGDHSGDYGSRDVGIIASEYDDFYFGTYDDDGNMLTTPKQFMETEGAKRFLNFNEDASTFAGEAVGGQYYTRDFDGETAYRVIYRPTCIHPAVTFSGECVGYAIDFFETTLGAPNPIASSDQIWQTKTLFNGVGLAGFFLFIVSFAVCMLDTPYFSALKAKDEVKAYPTGGRQGAAWFWALAAVSVVFSGVSYLWCMRNVYSNTTDFFPQTASLTIGIWSAACAVLAIVLMTVYYQCYGKRNGVSLKGRGVIVEAAQLGKAVLLAVIVIACAYGIVFFADYFFQTDFRIWVFGVKTFTSDKVLIALRYLPFFLLFYVVNSVSVNCFNYNQIGGEVGNILLQGLSSALASIVIVAVQYGYFYATSRQFFGLSEGERILPIWLFTVIPILFGAAVISRILYKKTRNPYLAGCINALFVTVFTCTNTFTSLSAGALIATTF